MDVAGGLQMVPVKVSDSHVSVPVLGNSSQGLLLRREMVITGLPPNHEQNPRRLRRTAFKSPVPTPSAAKLTPASL